MQDFEEGPWKHNNLDNGANMIIPVPQPLCGAVVLGESVITYFNQNQLKTVSLPQNVITVPPHTPTPFLPSRCVGKYDWHLGITPTTYSFVAKIDSMVFRQVGWHDGHQKLDPDYRYEGSPPYNMHIDL